MRVLTVHRYYWPDTPPYASLLRSIVRRWTDDGHDVEVLSSQPSYKPELALERRPRTERVDGAVVRRIALSPDRTGSGVRLFNVVAFPLLVGLRILLGRRRDVVMCSTAPPVVLGYVVSLAARARGARFVYHCMDLHPEIGAISGDFSHPLLRRALARMDLGSCRRASTVVVLSTDMRDALLTRDPALADRVVVLNNFDLPDYGTDRAPAPPVAAADGLVRLAFTGNLGRYQGLEAVTEAVLGDKPEMARIELVLMGEGGAKTSLMEQRDLAPADRHGRVRFVPHGTPAEARALLRSADLGLVSLTPEVIRYAYPSKTSTYLSEGLPVLARVEPDTEMVRTIASAGAGLHLPADPSGISDRLAELTKQPEHIAGMARQARAMWEREFSATSVLPRWSDLLEKLAPDPAADGGEGDGDVVIIGAPRSGTNMLRDILTSLPEFDTWDCDEINLTWRHGNRSLPHDELGVADATPQVRRYLNSQFERVRSSTGHRVVEKTCANSLRVPFVTAIKPRSKYVFITRDGLDVAPSAMIRWHAPFDLGYTLPKIKYVPASDLPYYGGRFALNAWRRRTESTEDDPGSWWGPKPRDWKQLLRERPLDEVSMIQWQRCVDQSEAGLASLPASQVHHVRYETFAKDPESELRRLLDFLGTKHGDLRELVEGVKASSVGRGRASLDDDARRRLAAIGGETLERLGYGA